MALAEIEFDSSGQKCEVDLMEPALWEFDDAKDHLKEVVDNARQQGEQTITQDGEPVVVVMSIEHFEKLEHREVLPSAQPERGTGASLIALLQRCPAPEIFDIMEEERRKDRARELRNLDLD